MKPASPSVRDRIAHALAAWDIRRTNEDRSFPLTEEQIDNRAWLLVTGDEYTMADAVLAALTPQEIQRIQDNFAKQSERTNP